MELHKGEYVMYTAQGICTFQGEEQKSFDGKNFRKYLILVPLKSDKSVYYIPENMADKKLRPLKSREEVCRLVDSIPTMQTCEWGEKNRRREFFGDVLKSDDSRRIISLIKSLYMKQLEMDREGKRLSSGEEDAMRTAESIIYQEFSVVLGIEQSKVREIFSEKIQSAKAG